MRKGYTWPHERPHHTPPIELNGSPPTPGQDPQEDRATNPCHPETPKSTPIWQSWSFQRGSLVVINSYKQWPQPRSPHPKFQILTIISLSNHHLACFKTEQWRWHSWLTLTLNGKQWEWVTLKIPQKTPWTRKNGRGTRGQETQKTEANSNMLWFFPLLWNQILILSGLRGNGTHF
jgi:hypothetical protein